MKRSSHRITLVLSLLTATITLQAQRPASLHSRPRTNENTENSFIYYGNAEKNYASFFQSLNNLILKGEGIVNIVQIGDSHIQAGFLPEEMRKEFATFISSGCGARGLIFPYRIAKTNNPADYSVKFTGKWEHCRNVELTKSCSLGLTGIIVSTRDTLAGMTFYFKENATFREFNYIRVFHDPIDTSFRIDFPGLAGRYSTVRYIRSGYTDIRFDSILRDSLRIRIVRKDTTWHYFTLYGIDFENEDAGIVYSASGVNGAEVTSYLRCDQLKDQLSSLKPAWVIVSLGTNDAYPLHFNKDEFIGNYVELVKKIREAEPGVPILLTVPGDSYRKHRTDNLNMEKAREAILETAKQTDCAVWDFYSLMGGPKSIMNWYKDGLVAKDKLHFDKQGYIIQADLLFGAFMNAYSSFIDQTDPSE
jgi:lysophospholipase L1-like esterase